MDIANLLNILSTGEYTLGNLYTTERNPDTRLVIVEKFPEKYSETEFEYRDGLKIAVQKFYVDVELIPVQKFITVNLNFKENEDDQQSLNSSSI